MNTTLQQRIDEAARKEREQCREDNNEIWRGNPTYNDVEASFVKGAAFALQNQWISVEEALPNESGDYLVIVKQSSDSEAYFHEISTYNATDNIWFYVGKLIVTHWMEIPKLNSNE